MVFKKAKQAGSLPKSQFPSDEEIASGILDELQVFRTSNEVGTSFGSMQKAVLQVSSEKMKILNLIMIVLENIGLDHNSS